MIDAILDYWIGPDDIDPAGWSEKQKLWYAADTAIDDEIRERFSGELIAAEKGQRQAWKNSAEGQLALIVLYDQFSRNLYRGNANVYRNDAEAVSVTDQLIDSGALTNLNVPAHILVFHPYHHAEDLDRQNRVLMLAESLLSTCPPEWRQSIEGNYTYMKNHAGVIRKFGRFPHRNRILGRDSTREEFEHLENDGRTFGQ
ncbi:MAG: DUF924 domain-containing protein [Gammaproteobacteria bacterium]|jgi:uncharacterized protein (DUF924 family)|nr:DUF924 domain-containing protein [Gammaproteobacteria bacterium]